MIAKYDIDPDDFYFASTLNAAAIGALPEEVNGKNRLESEKKLKSNLYLCIGDEAQRIFKARKPTVNIKTERYLRVLDEMQNVFQRERNVTHERGLFYGRKQRENETFEKFHAELSALAGRCDFANAAEIRDIFIMNMRESDCQRELSRSTKLPEEVYRIALSDERGERAYKSYTGKPASTAPAISIKQEPVSNIRRGQRFFRGRGRGGRGGYTKGSSSSGGSGNNRRCYNCDAPNFTLDHIASCPARRATWNSCRKLGHFERTCRGVRKGTNHWRGRGQVGLVREENEHHQSTQNVNDLNEDPVSWVNQQGCEENESMTSGSDDYMVMSIRKKRNETELKLLGARVQVEVSGKKMWLWIDSGSPVTIFSINDLKVTLGKANIQLQPSKDEFLDYNNNRINILGKVTVMMSLNGWAAPAQVSVISGNHQSILGRDLMGTLGLELVQRRKVMGITGEGISQEEEKYDELQTYFCKLYPKLFTRIGQIRNAKVRAEFYDNLRPIQQKGRRVPISLQDKVDKEIHRLINEGHIVKLQECSEKYFVSPIVITVKKDGSIKIALESGELNKQVHKNKYQMPNIDELIDGVSQIIAEKKAGNVYFTTLDFTYAYGQVALEQKTSEQCNFSLVGGKSTGTYRFKNGFYGLTSMPAEFQKVIDNLLKEFPQANAFIDDILISSKGTKIEHIALVEKILKKLDISNVALKLRKCEFAKTECEWLGFRIGESGITPLVRKTQAIEDLKTPKSRKQLKSLMGSLHSLHKFLPKLAELSAPLRPLLSQNNDFVWTNVCENAFQHLKSLVKNIVE